MRRLPLLPYALASVAIVVTSTLAISASLARHPSAPSRVAPAELVPTATGGVPALSATGRLAYWRADAGGAVLLWVSDIDGSRKWPVARVASIDDLGLTRWARDGSAVGYVLGGSTFVVVGLDGTQARYAMPSDVPADGRKIVGAQWSPDGARVALSLRAASGIGNESDVWILELERGRWERLTTLGDALAGPWIDHDRLFIETLGAMLAVADTRTNALRPLTAMGAVSPVAGSDGRIYFAGGSGGGANAFAAGPYTYGWIWSMTVEGDDLRQETRAPRETFRLEGRWPDGRYAIGVPGAVYLMGSDDVTPLPFHAGTIRRVHVLPGGRAAIGLTDSRVVRLEVEKVSASVPLGSPHPGIGVLLDGIREADVWSPPRSIETAPSPAPADRSPSMRLAFALGGGAWLEEPGHAVRPLVTRPSPQGWVGTPTWSPDGGRIAVAVSEGRGPEGRSTIAVLDRSGRRVGTFAGAEPIAWSPDGGSLAVTLPGTARAGPDRPPWEVLVYDVERGTLALRIPGRQPTWTPRGLFVLGNGEARSGSGWATRQPIELVTGGARRTVTTTERLAAHPLIARLPGAELTPTIAQVSASADGELLAVWLSWIDPRDQGIRSGALAIVRTGDGVPISAIANDPRTGIFGARWAPRGPYLGHTVTPPWTSPTPVPLSRAIVRDARTWAIPAAVEGRFAGWALDGEGFYVSRNEGLFAYRLDGTGGARVSAYGVHEVRAARP